MLKKCPGLIATYTIHKLLRFGQETLTQERTKTSYHFNTLCTKYDAVMRTPLLLEHDIAFS